MDPGMAWERERQAWSWVWGAGVEPGVGRDVDLGDGPGVDLGVDPGVGAGSHVKALFPAFEEPCTLFSVVTAPLCIPTRRHKGLQLLRSHLCLLFLRFDPGLPHDYEERSHCTCDLHFCNN